MNEKTNGKTNKKIMQKIMKKIMQKIMKKKFPSCVIAMILILGAGLFTTIFAATSENTIVGYPKAIAHAGGFIEGHTVTNSLEAVENAIANGFEFIELDMCFTTDGEIAMIHDWESSARYYLGLPSNASIPYETYKNCKIMERFHVLTMESLIALLEQNPSLRIITDTKEDNLRILTKIKQDYPDAVKRMIPQIYGYQEYDAVKALGYEQIILTLYKMSSNLNADEVAQFAKAKGIFAVTMAYGLVDTGAAQTLKNHGVVVYVHTVNSLAQFQNAKDKGAYGIYTDDLLREEIETAQSKYYLAKRERVYYGERLDIELQEGILDLFMMGESSTAKVVYTLGDVEIGSGVVNESIKIDPSLLGERVDEIKATIYDQEGSLITSRSYYFWRNGSTLLIVAKQYQYILEDLVPITNFDDQVSSFSNRVQEVIGQCFIAKLGSPVYYNNGKAGLYLNGAETLAPTKGTTNKILIPLYDTAVNLGAKEVVMSGGKTMMVNVDNCTYNFPIDSVSTWVEYENTIMMQTDIRIYRNKAIAGGNLYRSIFGRSYVQDKDIIVILPKGVSLTENIQKSLISSARTLYQ